MSAPGITRDERTLAATAAACAALVFVVVASSAWLRLVMADCPPAGCEGFTIADAFRLAHRVAAMGVSILALVVAAIAWKRPVRWGRRVAVIAMILLVVALAVIGRRSAGDAPPAVVLANLLGGLALLAFTVGVAAAARPPRGPLALHLTAVLLGVQATLGLAAPGWPLEPWLHAVLAAAALGSAVVAAVAAFAAREPTHPDPDLRDPAPGRT